MQYIAYQQGDDELAKVDYQVKSYQQHYVSTLPDQSRHYCSAAQNVMEIRTQQIQQQNSVVY